jgi:hypothetical protein
MDNGGGGELVLLFTSNDWERCPERIIEYERRSDAFQFAYVISYFIHLQGWACIYVLQI